MTDVILCGETLTIDSKFSHISLIQPNTSNYTLGQQIGWAIQQRPRLILVQTMPTNRIEWIDESTKLISMPIAEIMTTAEPHSKKSMISNYCTGILDPEVKHLYDMGLLQMWAQRAKYANVKTLFVLDKESEFLIPFLDEYLVEGDINDRLQAMLCE